MKVSRERAAENRDRIIEAAGRLFREKGFDGIGIAGLMKDAGMTHGGFYGHFGSKDDLAALACSRALAGAADKWTALAEDVDNPLSAIVTHYLSQAHRDAPGRGCALAALGPDAARQNRPIRRTFTDGLSALANILIAALPGSKAARRRRALATMAQMVGAVVLARAVDDPHLSKDILDATALELIGRKAA